MKLPVRNLSALTLLLTTGLSSADVIYSGLQNITIPATYDGVYLDVDGMTSSSSTFFGWDLNPFMGGVYLSNSELFQPARVGTSGMDRVVNISDGSSIGSGLNFATGSGGSLDHLGTQFTAGQEGYLGFKLSGTDYGWMRVVFTNNSSGAVIKDWAYDSTNGTAVVAGGIKQVGQDIILSSGFTLASALANSGGTTNLVKNGVGTNTLSATSTYTGTTTINAGTLVVNGNISTSSLTTVEAGATLGGNGTVGKTVVDGTLAVGNSPGQMNFTDTLELNGTTVMEIDGLAGTGASGGHDFINLTGTGSAGVLTYGGSLNLDIGTIFSNGTYSWNLFDMASETGTFATISLVDQYSGSLLDVDADGIWDLVSETNTWQFNEADGYLSLTVVPEPSVGALFCGMGLIILFRRRRA